MITMEHVYKSYRVAKRNAGMKEACKALFRREKEIIRALSDVSFAIQDGEMVGYIGPNGAGKSSTIKILSGILTPESGTCLVDGAYHGRIGKNMCGRLESCLANVPSCGGMFLLLILLNS